MRSAPHSATACCEREALLADDDVTQAFVGRAIFIGGGRGGGEPAFVDAAAVQAEGVEIVGMQLEAFARLEEGAGHPAGREAQQAAAVFERALDKGANFFLDRFERGDCVHVIRADETTEGTEITEENIYWRINGSRRGNGVAELTTKLQRTQQRKIKADRKAPRRFSRPPKKTNSNVKPRAARAMKSRSSRLIANDATMPPPK